MTLFNINRSRSTHGARLERWLGAGQVEHLSRAMKQWYGPPIAVGGVPGNVWAHGGGDFHGIIRSGQVTSAVEFAVSRLKRIVSGYGQRQRQYCGAGFASLSDLISEATTGAKRREIFFHQVGTTGVSNVTSSLWRVGPQPAAGTAASAAPGGRVPTGATTGAQYLLDNVSPDTRHFVSANLMASITGNNLLMYDRIFDVAKTMNSAATESVTGVPTRYQSSTVTDANYAGGNFCFVEVGTALPATAHNWTVCQYRNQAATDAQSFPSMTGNASAIINRLDHPSASWFMPLATGDTGVMDLAQMQSSASLASGAVNFVIGHPLAWMPCPVANMVCTIDGINTAFNLVRIFDDAALTFLEINKPASSATTYTGGITFVHG